MKMKRLGLRTKITLRSLLMAAVICAGTCTVGYFTYRSYKKKLRFFDGKRPGREAFSPPKARSQNLIRFAQKAPSKIRRQVG